MTLKKRPTNAPRGVESHATVITHRKDLRVVEFYPCRGTGHMNLTFDPWALLDIGYGYPVLLDGMAQIIEFFDALYPDDPSWEECEGALEEEMVRGSVPWIYDMRELIEESHAPSIEFHLEANKAYSIGNIGLPSNVRQVIRVL